MEISDLKNMINVRNEIKHINEELETLRCQVMSPRRSILSDVPKGTPFDNDKMAAFMIRVEELEEKYNEQLKLLYEKQHSIETMIEKLEPIERDLIRYRYIDGLYWHEVQARLNYGQRQVFRMHEKILKKLKKMDKTEK